ncbi:MAG: hypothetical protein ACOC38_04460 [Promethearchaeia archaeon]
MLLSRKREEEKETSTGWHPLLWATTGFRNVNLNRKTTAVLIVIVIIAASGLTVFLLLQQPGAPTPIDTPSDFADAVQISEIHYNQTLTVNQEFFEIYISEGYREQTLSCWYVTTFDEEGMLALPTIDNIDAEDYIAVYGGTGEDDLDASDGSASIHLGLTDRLLDPLGDEIGIFNENGHVIDYVRYNGGNGDDTYDNWPDQDDGPSIPSNHTGSISLFGFESANTSKWMLSLISPARPNVYSFLAIETGYTVTITNGANRDFSFDGIDDAILSKKGEKVDVCNKSGVDGDYIKEIKKHIAYSLDFYHKKGFTRGPVTYKPGKINVTVLKGSSNETVGKASNKGHIVLEIGKKKSDTDLKYVCEHELMHLFQYKTEKKGNDTVDHAPVANKFWIEGQATYWGIESTRANYNLTHKEIQDEFKRVGDHNWYEHYTDLNRSIFKGWGGSYSDYMGSYLFNKFMAEVFGEDKLKQIFDTAQDNFNNNSRDVSPKEAIAQVLGKSWEQVLAEFHAWMMTGAIEDNGVPERKTHINVTYSNDTVSDRIKVGSYAAGVERIKVNSTQPFKVSFNVHPTNSKWKITIIYVYEDGSRRKMPQSPFNHGPSFPHVAVNPESHPKKLIEVIVIKSHVEDSVARINMTVEPIPRPGPVQITPNGGPYEFKLPWDFGNSTPFDWPWEVFWNFTYYTDLHNYELKVNTTAMSENSAFNLTIESPIGPVLEETEITAGDNILISFDPEHIWDFGEYKITLFQYNWTSILNGTIELLEDWREGAVPQNPIPMIPDQDYPLDSMIWRTGECKWYELALDPDFDYNLFIEVDLGFESETDWYIEIYNSTDLDTLLATNEREYANGEWPRELLLPRFFEEAYPADGICLVRIVFAGSVSGATGHIIVNTAPVAGSSIDNPLWHNGDTEYFGVPLPYSIHEGGLLFINASLTQGQSYSTWFNCSEPLTAQLWNGIEWLDFTPEAEENSLEVSYEAVSGIICIRFDVVPSPESVIFYIVTVISDPG